MTSSERIRLEATALIVGEHVRGMARLLSGSQIAHGEALAYHLERGRE